MQGPVREIVADLEYLDITLLPGTQYTHLVKLGYTAAAYIIEGSGSFDPGTHAETANRTLLLFSDGDCIRVTASGDGARFLFFSGKPIKEPVAWGGPIVMNTQGELSRAFAE